MPDPTRGARLGLHSGTDPSGRPKRSLSLVVWNVQFRRAVSDRGRLLREAIAACAPDVVCITEAHPDFLDLPHLVLPAGDHGYAAADGRRKVLLWSREPWHAVDPVGDPSMPAGRYVAGRTLTPIGMVGVHGVCIPWAQAHVATGRRDRRPWEDHMHYLDGLRRVLASPSPPPTILAGDFNQAIPRRRAPRAVFDALMATLPPHLRCVTAGPVPMEGLAAIDHVAVTSDLAVLDWRALPRFGPDAIALSDHFGLHLRLACADDGPAG